MELNFKQLVLSFDDSPHLDQIYFTGENRINNLISILQQNKIQSVFFIWANKISMFNSERLNYISQNKHFIGNHSFRHNRLTDTSIKKYIYDINKAEERINIYSGFKKWFRYPYLDEGPNPRKAFAIREALAKLDYLNYYVTIPTYDFFLDELFQYTLSLNLEQDIQLMKNFYIKVILKNIDFYYEMALSLLGYSPRHILLLHENDFTVLCLPDLINELSLTNWQIISPFEALQDQLVAYQPTTYPIVLGKINCIAQDIGIKSRFPKELNERFLYNQWKAKVYSF